MNAHVLNESDRKLLLQLNGLDGNGRMIKVISWSETGDIQYFKPLQYVLLNDPDMGVKFAILKRLHLFKQCRELVFLLETLQNSGQSKAWEPYLSMALSQAGLITLEEFKERINKG